MRPHVRLSFLVTFAAVAILPSCYNAGDLGNTPFKCTGTYPDCPNGYVCCGIAGSPAACPNPADPQHWCVSATGTMMPGSLAIPKPVGGAYPNAYLLNMGLTPASCPDQKIEPNNTIAQATPDFDSMALPHNGLSICPSGDIDVYSVNLTNQFVRVSIKYKIDHGDLDLGLFDANGMLQLSDPDFTKDDACVSSPVAFTGTYYAVVVGAPNSIAPTVFPMNLYSGFTVEKSSSPLPCGGSSLDMSGLGDFSEVPDMAF